MLKLNLCLFFGDIYLQQYIEYSGLRITDFSDKNEIVKVSYAFDCWIERNCTIYDQSNLCNEMVWILSPLSHPRLHQYFVLDKKYLKIWENMAEGSVGLCQIILAQQCLD